MQKILIVQTAFIGDVVLATGLLEKLHQHYPNVQLDILVRKGNEHLFKGHPYLHDVLVWNKQVNKYLNLFTIIRKVRANHYHVIVNVQRFFATGLLTVLSGAKMTIGFTKNPLHKFFSKSVDHSITSKGKSIHEIERNHLLIDNLTDSIVAMPRLYPSKSDLIKIEEYQTKDYICIAPSSVWFTKQFPVNKWIEFLQKLRTDLPIYLLGAPSDSNLCNEIVCANPHLSLVNLAGKLSFLESAALMKNALMNYVNDSAPMHFASAVDAPVAAIYCSTIPSFGFGPLSTVQHIIEVKETLPCRPCGLHGKKSCPLKHFDCANKIDSNELIHCLELLERPN